MKIKVSSETNKMNVFGRLYKLIIIDDSIQFAKIERKFYGNNPQGYNRLIFRKGDYYEGDI